MTFKTYGRSLLPGQRCDLTVFDIESGDQRIVYSTRDAVIEAPNWTPNGDRLLFNAGGELWTISVVGGDPARLDTGSLSDLNNDHVISPDGSYVFVSSDDGHLYCVSLKGGTPARVSNEHSGRFQYYLHGVSPDGRELAYVGLEDMGGGIKTNLFTIPSTGGPDRRLSDIDRPNDGPEYSPDGRFIYFNSERSASVEGHAQIFRMDRDGTDIQQLTFDERVNWFPHISPDGSSIVYLSFPSGTLGHPANKDVILRSMNPGGSDVRDLASFHGGQGTINVNSWSPDSRQFAFVAYPLD